METTQEKKKLPKLTKKQRGFVNDYVKTGIGEVAALNNYDIQAQDKENVARSIASENLTKPNIVKAISERLPDELLEEKHLALLNKMEMFETKDEEGKLVSVESNQIDAQAVARGLDMAYKIKGAYGDSEKPKEKGTNIYNFFFSKDIQDKVQNLEADIKEKLKQKNVQTP